MLNASPNSVSSIKSLADTQIELCNLLRKPEIRHTPSTYDERRLTVYRDLVYNNIESLLSGGLPVTKRILSQADASVIGPYSWDHLVRQFIYHYRSQTPYFAKIVTEFYSFLQDKNLPGHLLFILELVEYEILELELIYKEDPFSSRKFFDRNKTRLALSPVTLLRSYRYRVHRLDYDNIPTNFPSEPSYLVIYKTAGKQISFQEINRPVFDLLNLVADNPGNTVVEWLDIVKKSVSHIDENIISNYLNNLTLLFEQQFTKGVLVAI